MLNDADEEPGDQVDRHDHDRGDRVAAHKLADTIHRGVEIRLAPEVAAAAARLFLADTAGVEVRVDRHLLARHRIERETRRDFRDPARALGHHREIDDRDDDEDYDSDRIVVADDDASEGFDYGARSVGAEVAVEQYESGRGDIERESKQGRDQQYGREGGKIQRTAI